ncbi:MAG: hypothetical protein ACI836_000964 [Saprospiraceae bacterium]|jgi:hypothetical protein|uniref:DUF6252 family protein n=1 Tax=Patiriisocius sp. Uisw_047 TaxID=3230969 RepID=UPI0039EB562F
MKTTLVTLFIVAFMASCTVREDNSPALQGTIDENFFSAIDARAVENEDGSFYIQGTTQNRDLTMHVTGPSPGLYSFGGDSNNFAMYKAANQVTYFTNPFGEGQAIITDWDAVNRTLTGRFGFTATVIGVDTVEVSNGIFYKVPYDLAQEVDPPTITDAGYFVAKVDDVLFAPFAVSAIHNDGLIRVTGSTSTESMSLTIPSALLEGVHQITEPGFAASYRLGATTELAISGQVILVSHDVANRVIIGTYSFMTENHSITIGQFNVTYQNF